MAIVQVGTADIKESPPAEEGIVLYCDAGVRPVNPGFAGWGFHGYLYRDEKPKKGSGNPSYGLSANGYVLKTKLDKSQEVTPLEYFDGFGSFASHVTNNVGELQAAIESLRLANQFKISRVLILTDSKYVCEGTERYLPNWIRNGWTKADGQAVSNIDYWKDLVAIRSELEARGVKVSFDWVKGHSDILGNIYADQFATMGVMASMRGEMRTEIERSPADGYWKYSPEKHPMFGNIRLYFNTLAKYSVPGEYYLGDHGKEDDLFGTRNSQGAFSFLRLKNPIEEVEQLRSYVSKLAEAGTTDNIMIGRMEKFFRPETHKLFSKYKEASLLHTNLSRLDLHAIDKEPLVTEMRPAKLAMRAVECLSDLENQLTKYLNKDADIVTTDLTSVFYDVTTEVDKKKVEKTVFTLKPEYCVGFASLKVQTNYQSENDGIQSVPITLVLGIDLLDRNCLKRLEVLEPKVTLITWMEAPTTIRYATVIEAGEDVGIWAGCYSNFRFITERDLVNKT